MQPYNTTSAAGTYAEVIDGIPTGAHRNYGTPPVETEHRAWLKVIYSEHIPQYNPIKEELAPKRTVQGKNVLFEEVAKPLSIERVRVNQLSKLSEQYDQLLKGGYQITDLEFSLNFDQGSRNVFTGLFIMLKEAVSSGAKSLSDGIVISDTEQKIHTITIEKFFSIMPLYAIAYQDLWLKIASANNAITSAQTVEDVMLVTL